MGFADDFKEDQTLQIQVVCVAFFLIVFPTYFFMKAAATDDPSGMGGVGTYTVTAEFSYIDFDNGGEYIADGDTLTIPLNTDSLNSDDMDKNIVGVLVTMTYEEDEQAQGLTCAGPLGGQAAADTITGVAYHMNYSNTADGQNQGGSGSHEVSTTWFNSSVIGDKIEGLSESQIIDDLEKQGTGLGDYIIEISVSAQAGNAPGPDCSRSDNGEDVSYTIQLVVLDYSIAPYVDLDDIDV